jgi:hypothetical protein
MAVSFRWQLSRITCLAMQYREQITRQPLIYATVPRLKTSSQTVQAAPCAVMIDALL